MSICVFVERVVVIGGIKRPYTAADIASKRGSQHFAYPSSVMATKLFNLIREREAKGEPVHTMGAIDPVQMTQQAPHQEVLYISGWACSSLLTSTNEVSPDFGDYPYNTVPNQVQRLAKAQSMHDRKQWDARRKLSPAQRAERGSYIGCIAGALSRSEYLDGLAAAGFTDASVDFTHEVAPGLHGAIVKATRPTTGSEDPRT